jgi:hypothetical protein
MPADQMGKPLQIEHAKHTACGCDPGWPHVKWDHSDVRLCIKFGEGSDRARYTETQAWQTPGDDGWDEAP